MSYSENRVGSGIFSTESAGKGFVSFIYKELLEINKKKINMSPEEKKNGNRLEQESHTRNVENKFIKENQH